MFTGTLYNLSHSLKRQVINKTTYVCAARCGINAVACRHSTVSADVRFVWKQERRWGHGEALPLCLRVTPSLPLIKTKGLYKCFLCFIGKGCLIVCTLQTNYSGWQWNRLFHNWLAVTDKGLKRVNLHEVIGPRILLKNEEFTKEKNKSKPTPQIK